MSASSVLTGTTTRSTSPPSGAWSIFEYACCSRARRSAASGGASGVVRAPPVPATASTAPDGREHRGLVDVHLLGRARQRAGEIARILGDRHRHLVGLVDRVLQEIVERLLAERQPAFERAVHAHVEPALDAAADELHGHRIHEHAGKDRDQREQQHEANREPRPEDAGLRDCGEAATAASRRRASAASRARR